MRWLMQNHRRDIAYSLDAALVGCYLWLGGCTLQIGGTALTEEDAYPFTLPTPIGCGIVLPGYRVFTIRRGYKRLL